MRKWTSSWEKGVALSRESPKTPSRRSWLIRGSQQEDCRPSSLYRFTSASGLGGTPFRRLNGEGCPVLNTLAGSEPGGHSIPSKECCVRLAHFLPECSAQGSL